MQQQITELYQLFDAPYNFFCSKFPVVLEKQWRKKEERPLRSFFLSKQTQKISFRSAEQVQQYSSVFLNVNTHLSKFFYFNISECPTYSKQYHCQANILILSPCTLRIVDVCQIKNQINSYISQGQTLLISSIYNTSNS